MQLFKITIDCNIAGCTEESEEEFETQFEADEYAEQLAQETFAPSGSAELIV